MTTDYCGFVCSEVVEKAKEIRKELDDFARYNPEEAEVVLGNVLKALRKRTKHMDWCQKQLDDGTRGYTNLGTCTWRT